MSEIIGKEKKVKQPTNAELMQKIIQIENSLTALKRNFQQLTLSRGGI